MIEFVRIDGTAVRVASLKRRAVEGTDGAALREVTLVIVARDEQTHGAVLALVAPGELTLEIPAEDGVAETFPAAVVSVGHVTLGSGERTAYRHEVTLRERDPASADALETGTDTEVGLRLEALIAALDAAGVISRTAVDAMAHQIRQQRADG